MQIELINQQYIENRTEFKVTSLKRNWDILIMVVEGEYEVLLKESQKTVVLKKNDIMLIPAGIEFERKITSELTCYHFYFYPQTDHPFYLSANLGKINLPTEQTTAVFNMLQRAFVLADNSELLTHIIEHVFAQNYIFSGKDKKRFKPFSQDVENAIRYMRNNFHKKIDIDNVAREVFLSHSGLIWKFKQELNITPSGYLSILRLNHSKHLLLNSACSITEISELCGYANPYYFTNAFRHHFGISPSQFRKQHLKKDNISQGR